MLKVFLLIVYIVTVYSRCQCEELQEHDCKLRSKNEECQLGKTEQVDGQESVFQCKKVECKDKSTKDFCERSDNCYWAGLKTKCLNKPTLCIEFYFDENQLQRCKDYDCHWNNFEKYCADPVDCEQFTNSIDCRSNDCYFDGNLCYTKNCFNYRNELACAIGGCVYRNGICYQKACEHQQKDDCDGKIVNNEMCMLEGGSICRSIEFTADCHEYQSEKTCNYFDERCEWYKQVVGKEESYSCIDLKKLNCNEIDNQSDCLYFYYKNKQMCEWKVDDKNVAKCQYKKEFTRSDCHTNTLQTHRWLDDEDEDNEEKGKCEICLRINIDKLWAAKQLVLALVFMFLQ